MRTRKAVITVALAGAALAATAASPAFAATPYVGHNVGGGLVTRQALTVGQHIDLLGHNGRNVNYQVTKVSRNGESYYDTVWPRIQSASSQLLFTTSN